ncbi:MAG: peptidylprolyl isomerase [Planctomycetota bacterium]|jgi:hypothetical protein
MEGYPRAQYLGSLALAAASTALFACTPRADSSGQPPRDDAPTARTSPSATPVPSPSPRGGAKIASTVIDARPAALVNGRVVGWGELRPLLNEAAGSEVLREVVLDRMVGRAMADAGIIISADDVDAERQLFYSMLSPDPDVAVRLARELRARQGLGRERFARLLERNASLRALVRDEVQVTEEAVRRLHEIIHGAKRQARLMILPTLAETEAALERVESGAFFGDVAVESSTDSSAARGGLLEPISRADPSYPQSMRDALWTLAPGEVSPPVLIGDSYAVLLLVRELEGDQVDLEEARPKLERLVRLNQERLLMDRLARDLLGKASVTVFDDALKERWER